MIGNNTYKYCSEDISLIENYEIAKNDPTQIWDIHHRRETIYTRDGLIEIGEYYNRPAAELIFLTRSDHNKFHKRGTHHSDETRQKMRDSKLNLPEETKSKMRLATSIANKGRTTWMKGKHHSDEAKRKLAIAHLGKRTSAETRAKQSQKQMGMVFWNDGKVNVRSRTSPGKDFKRGKLNLHVNNKTTK